MWVTVRAASHPPVWIHRKCELRSLKKPLNGLCLDDDYTIAQRLEHRWLQARVPGSSPGDDNQFFLQTFPVCLFPSKPVCQCRDRRGECIRDDCRDSGAVIHSNNYHRQTGSFAMVGYRRSFSGVTVFRLDSNDPNTEPWGTPHVHFTILLRLAPIGLDGLC